ncbi:deoxyribodipyrimidine photo-lyase [Hyphococcus formosus]|uniref:cryptochrome/photolyase family protein n=1 Tax=Hyphococcus formosus TaxID=3143534 RepID=UPI00398AD7D4
MKQSPIIVWFRNDLRIADNPALSVAAKSVAPVIPLYIYDRNLRYAPGGASRWWLHESLSVLNDRLKNIGSKLILRSGDETDIIRKLIKETNASAVYWNRRYYKSEVDTDKKLKSALSDAGINVETFNASLLREPWEIETGSGTPYRVFTPFWKKLKEAGPNRVKILPEPKKLKSPKNISSENLKEWQLQPTNPDWAEGIAGQWKPGETEAMNRLNEFLDDEIDSYSEGRDRPDKEFTSRLSPYLHFGEISPNQIWNAVKLGIDADAFSQSAGYKFLSELAWREFSYSLLYYNPSLPKKPLRKEFTSFPWRKDTKALWKWQRGETGYPIVDAGMRQLWQTGWMHNRVRMIVASFLIKDLLIPWQQGASWFLDTLVDADLANNSAGWQWVAGSGADASPFFRIFNPVTQGEKFDPHGDYVREFVPELKDLPDKYIHSPWKAPEHVLQEAGITLGNNYNKPIVDHAEARDRALAGYNEIKGK